MLFGPFSLVVRPIRPQAKYLLYHRERLLTVYQKVINLTRVLAMLRLVSNQTGRLLPSARDA